MPMLMGPMGPMGYASMPGRPMMVPMMLVGAPPRSHPLPPQHVALLDAACRGRSAAVFYKTRICHK